MISSEMPSVWLGLSLFGFLLAPEVIKSISAHVLTTTFALVVGIYWWMTSHVIRELWDTT